MSTICKHTTHRSYDAVGYAQNSRSFLNNVFAYGRGTRTRTVIDRLKAGYSNHWIIPRIWSTLSDLNWVLSA